MNAEHAHLKREEADRNGREAIAITWKTRASIKAGGYAYLEPKMHKIVTRRLKRMLCTAEEISRIIMI